MRKSKLFTAGVLALMLILGLVLAGCGETDDGGNNNNQQQQGDNTAVTFSNVTANGSSSQTTTQLTLTFSQAITGLSASDINLSGVSGVSNGSLSGSNPYTLGISGFTSGGTLNVSVSKSGYTISGSPQTATIYHSGSSGGGGGDPSELIATWYGSQENADNGFQEYFALYANGDISLYGTGIYSYEATGDTITTYYYGNFYGTASYVISGTMLVFSNVTGYIPFSDDTNYYKRSENRFNSLSANGNSSQSTTQLTLTFDGQIDGLSANHIFLSGVDNVIKGTLTAGNYPNIYILPISGFTSGGTLSVSVIKPGYSMSTAPKTVTIYYFDNNFTLVNVTANGSSTQTTSQLTLTFDRAIPGLAASDINLSGASATKGSLSGSNPYTLGITGVTSNGTLNVAVSKAGYDITGSPKSVSIYYYYSAPPPNTNPPGTPTLNVTRNGNNLNLTWSFPSSGGRPDSIKFRAFDPTYNAWVDVETLSGTATSTSINYTLWVDAEGAVKLGIVGTNNYGSGSRAGTFNTKTGVWY